MRLMTSQACVRREKRQGSSKRRRAADWTARVWPSRLPLPLPLPAARPPGGPEAGRGRPEIWDLAKPGQAPRGKSKAARRQGGPRA